MEPAAIIEALQTQGFIFPHEAVAAALEQRGAVTPGLLELLEQCLDEADVGDLPESNAHIYAMLLLAVFREARAYPLVARLSMLPTDMLDELIGDLVTDGLDSILLSVCGGDTRLIQELIENPEADEYARSAGLDALLGLFVAGVLKREWFIAYFRKLFEGGLELVPSFVWDALCSCATNIYPDVLLPHIEAAYDTGLANNYFMPLGEVYAVAEQDRAEVLSRLPQSDAVYMQDVAEECLVWAEFKDPGVDPAKRPRKRENIQDLFSKALFIEEWSTPLAISTASAAGPPQHVKKTPAPISIGPNSPCLCGSGKKFKKCCGRQDQ